MKKNMGSIDRAVRALIAVVVVVLYFTNIITGTPAIILLTLSGILVVTSILGICPLYMPFNLSSLKKE